MPLAISPHDRHKLYVGSQHVHQTTNGGQSWQEISPDLTLNDKTRQGSSGGLTPDNIGVEYAGVVFAIAAPASTGVPRLGYWCIRMPGAALTSTIAPPVSRTGVVMSGQMKSMPATSRAWR